MDRFVVLVGVLIAYAQGEGFFNMSVISFARFERTLELVRFPRQEADRKFHSCVALSGCRCRPV